MKILLVYQHPVSFVKDDIELLGEMGNLATFEFGSFKGNQFIDFGRTLHRQRAWLSRHLRDADVLVGWFVDYHMYLPTKMAVRRGVPIAVSVGGFDAVHLAPYGHGLYHNPWRTRLALPVYHSVDMVLPVAQELIYSENQFSLYPKTLVSGIKAHVPNFRTPTKVLPTGYVPEKWPFNDGEREDLVLGVAGVSRMRTFIMKGYNLVVEIAKLMPDMKFRLVGIAPEIVPAIQEEFDPPSNVELLPPVPREALVDHYQRAKVFLHPSRVEGMPNVLCEAMLCGCYPVVSRVFGNASAVGPEGIVVDIPDATLFQNAIREALGATAEQRARARSRIATKFSRDARREGLAEVFSRLRIEDNPRHY